MIFKSSSRFYGPLLQAKLETTVYTFYDPLDYCQPPLLDSPDRRDFSHWTRKEKKSSPNPVRRKIRSLFHFENPWELIKAAAVKAVEIVFATCACLRMPNGFI